MVEALFTGAARRQKAGLAFEVLFQANTLATISKEDLAVLLRGTTSGNTFFLGCRRMGVCAAHDTLGEVVVCGSCGAGWCQEASEDGQRNAIRDCLGVH